VRAKRGWADGVSPAEVSIGIKLVVSCLAFAGSVVEYGLAVRLAANLSITPVNWRAVALSSAACPTRRASSTASVDLTTALHCLHRAKLSSGITSMIVQVEWYNQLKYLQW